MLFAGQIVTGMYPSLPLARQRYSTSRTTIRFEFFAFRAISVSKEGWCEPQNYSRVTAVVTRAGEVDVPFVKTRKPRSAYMQWLSAVVNLSGIKLGLSLAI